MRISQIHIFGGNYGNITQNNSNIINPTYNNPTLKFDGADNEWLYIGNRGDYHSNARSPLYGHAVMVKNEMDDGLIFLVAGGQYEYPLPKTEVFDVKSETFIDADKTYIIEIKTGDGFYPLCKDKGIHDYSSVDINPWINTHHA